MNFSESPEDKAKIELTAGQWELLQTTRSSMNEEMARCISVAVKRNDAYELYLSETEVDDLIDYLETQAEAAKGPKQQDALFELADYLLDFSVGDEDDIAYGPPVKNISQMTGDVYVFKVALVEDNKIWRRIALRGGQSLHDLHEVIFEAFDREEEHLYSFYVPPTPIKSQSVRKFMDCPDFTHPYALEEGLNTMIGMFLAESQPHNAAQTAIQELELSEKHKLLYLFDFGDEWLHWVTVEQIDGKPDTEPYPRILERHGSSPPQYGFDDEWDEQDDDFDDE